MAEIDTGLLHSQDFKLKECLIITALGNFVDFTPIVLEIQLFEDIYNPVLTGSLMITDSVGFLNILGFNGNEFLKLTFTKPSLDTDMTKIFRIYKVSDRKLVKDQNEGYVLNFCSEELFLSEQIKLSKSYPGQKISNIVSKILTDTLKVSTTKFNPKNIEDTRGTYDFIVPMMKPLEAISWLSTYAIPSASQSPGSSFLFFENIDGYNFKSISTLYQGQVKTDYFYGPKNIQDLKDPRIANTALEMRTVLSYEHLNNFDSLSSTADGAFSNRLITIDTLLRKYKNTDFDYLKYFGTEKPMNPNPVQSNAQNRFGLQQNENPAGAQKVLTTNTTQISNAYVQKKQNIKPFNVETYVPYRTAQFSLLNMHRMKLLVPGDINIHVGDKINFHFYELQSTEIGRKEDGFYSGTFLVTAIRHTLTQRGSYTMVMEICKDSMPTNFYNFNNQAKFWKTIRGS